MSKAAQDFILIVLIISSVLLLCVLFTHRRHADKKTWNATHISCMTYDGRNLCKYGPASSKMK